MSSHVSAIVGTDGSSLADPTVGRAAWLARHNDADLVIIGDYPADRVLGWTTTEVSKRTRCAAPCRPRPPAPPGSAVAAGA